MPSQDPATLPVLDSVAAVLDRFERARIHPDAIQPALSRWGGLLRELPPWDRSLHYHDGTPETVRWIFVLDVLNHCFWPDPTELAWTVTYHGEPFSGYWGLAACLKRAMEDGIPLTRADFLETLSPGSLATIVAGAGRIPLFMERLANLREAGSVLRSRWQGDILHLLEASRRSAVQAVKLVVESFPSFRDEALYDGSRVYLWKRAQIFVSDIHQAFSGRGWGAFDDIDRLTAFADYKLPQVLRALGILTYRRDLEERIDERACLEPGGREEVEIRATTLWAVELIRRKLIREGCDTTSAQVDHWLWQLGQLDAFRGSPYHRCRTIFY